MRNVKSKYSTRKLQRYNIEWYRIQTIVLFCIFCVLEIQVKGFLTHTFGIRSAFGVWNICIDIVPSLSWRWDLSVDPNSVIFICRWYIQLGGNFLVFSGSVLWLWYITWGQMWNFQLGPVLQKFPVFWTFRFRFAPSVCLRKWNPHQLKFSG